MRGGILYEHGHRMIASFVGLLTVILAVWLRVKEKRRWVRNLGFVALGTVILQGILGGLTVLFLLPAPLSAGHAALAQTFFAIVCSIALFTSPWWNSETPPLEDAGKKISTARLGLFATACVFVQLVLGATMRHTQAGLAVPDLPLAYGQLFPSLAPEAITRYNDQLLAAGIRIFADGPVTSAQVLIHMLHRFWGLATASVVIWTSFRAFKSRSKRLRAFGWILCGLAVVQILLGALTVLSRKAVDVTTAHVAVGAVLLVACLLLSLNAVRVFGWRRKHQVLPLRAQEAAA